MPPPPPAAISLSAAKLNTVAASTSSVNYDVNKNATIRLYFNNAVDKASVVSSVTVKEAGLSDVALVYTYEKSDSVIVLSSPAAYKPFTKYIVNASKSLRSSKGRALSSSVSITFVTSIDSANKFAVVDDSVLLDKVQQQTFKYFWDYGHPVSGLARERSNSGENIVTSGGSGFGIMCIPVAVKRNFISKADGLLRMQKIVGFLKNTADKFHGAFPHWLDGATGTVIPFSTKDNGADLVETSYLMAGLLTARQYFNGAGADETTLRGDISALYNNVEWDWFRNGGQNVLYWHWSPNYNWEMNLPIRGWNECLVTYILAASSTTHGIPVSVYINGWASGSNFTNGASYLGYQLPLGTPYGGPLFFSHYTFLGISPVGLQDVYANYEKQTKNHTLINYTYCVNNPKRWYGYSDKVWGLTASDIQNGYDASSPTNDIGYIAPTAALSSFPYTPTESMKALKFFYYTLGDKIWKEYGFVDAFSLKELWFANSFLAIDQGPIVIMIENYRSRMVWDLFTSCPEVKNGMRSLGFTAPYL